ncbi:MAG: inorganic diphosphatase [Candidatus Bathyarchaeia archaeon]
MTLRDSLRDEKGVDPKILSVPSCNLRFENYKDIADVPKRLLTEIQEFFETYKRLEPCKWVKVKCWKNTKDAQQIVTAAIKSYSELGQK